MTEPFICLVRGIPTPKGSKRVVPAGGKRGGYPILIDNNPKGLRAWEYAIRSVLQQEWKGPPVVGPVAVSLEFTFLRPLSVSARQRPYPTVAPDWDKLARAACDSLSGIIIRDDAQIVRAVVSKDYGEESGVRIAVSTPEEAAVTEKGWAHPPELPRSPEPPWYADALAGLIGLGHKTRKAQAMLEGIEAESAEEAMRLAWKRKVE